MIWANKAMREAFNLKPGQLNGTHCYMGCTTGAGLQHLLRRKRPSRPASHDVVDFSSYKKNWVLRSYPVRDEQGAINGVVEIVTDITERRKAEEAMRQSEQKFRELFENANDMIFLLDFKGKILS